MGFDQYHEPPEEIRTFARMITSLSEEAGWYEQRMSVEKEKDAKAIMANAQEEEFKHFGMNLDFCCTRTRTGGPNSRASCSRRVRSSSRARLPKRKSTRMSRWDALIEDKRRPRRTRVLKAGMISLGEAAISCAVRNLTKSGAMLDVVSPLGAPREFTLVISSDEVRHECRIVWIKERRIGVSFKSDGGS